MLPIRSLGVADDLLEAGMAGDGRNFVRGAASFGKPSCGSLAQPMSATAMQAGSSTLF
jgi:hypothetical protein